jgi:Ca-activated chloride channel family protein
MDLATAEAGMTDWPTSLHWLRPAWLWALLALPLLWAAWNARRKRESIWREVVDPHLLPHLLARGDASTRGFGLWAMIAYALAVLALAGPSWRQVEQPLWQTRAPLVIALDLSDAMLAPDLPPTRLLQARAKIATLLRERAGGQAGLVAYADDAFTVAPLTDDSDNLALFLDALAPDVMPMDGSRSDRAIDASARLLEQAGFERGDILLLTDHADGDALAAARRAARAGYRVSALGLGSAAGAAYRTAGGAIAMARLDASSLRAMTRAGGGAYAAATADDSDLRGLGVLDPSRAEGASLRGGKGSRWQDEGYWLLPPLLLLSLFAFRRGGALAASLLLAAALPWSPARAAGQDLWRRPDQQAYQRMLQGVAAYRNRDFAAAERAWKQVDTADGHYNHGNALAKAGRYPEAIAAYDRALRKQPGMADALANKRAVEAAMKRKPPQGSRQGNHDEQNQQRNSNPRQGQDGQPPRSAASSGNGASQSQPSSPPPQPPQDQAARQAQGSAPPKPQDAAAQSAADAAQRQRMQQALAAQGAQKPGARTQPPQVRNETAAERERRQANEAWLRRVPDDPGGLLRAKFRLEQERRQQSGSPP